MPMAVKGDGTAGDGRTDDSLSADFYEHALGTMAYAVVATDLSRRVRYWNAAAEQLYGYPAAEALGRPVQDLIVPVDLRAAARREATRLTTGHRYIGDWRVRDRGNREFTVSVAATPITDPDGAIVGMLGVSYDVSQRRQTHPKADEVTPVIDGAGDAMLIACDVTDPTSRPQAPTRQQHRVQVNTDRGLLPRALISPQGKLDSMNRAFCLLLHRSRAELMGMDARALRHPGDGTFDDKLGPVLAGHAEAEAWEAVLVRRDGTPLSALVHASMMRHADGSPECVAMFVQDLTGLRRAEGELQRREALFEALARRTSDWAFVLDDAGLVRYASPAAAAATGCEADEMVGRLGWELAHPDDVTAVRGAFLRVAADLSRTEMVTFRSADRAGEWWWTEAVFTNCLDDPHVAGILCNRRDVTARVHAERALRDSESQYRAIADIAQEGIWTIDTSGRTHFANRKLADILGLPLAAVYARWVPGMLSPDDTMLVEQRLLARREYDVQEYELTYPHPDGQPRILRLSVSPLRGDSGRPTVLAMISDVTVSRRKDAELRRRALYDEITGLGNRALLMDQLELTLARSSQRPGRVAVLFADLDQFKLVNDSWGHGTGDRLLTKVAQRLADAVRPGDSVARFGGDEFVVLCEDVSDGGARDLAEGMLEALTEPFQVDGQRVYVRASIGIATSPPTSAPDLLRFAEAAMYTAKARGRARVQIFDVGLAEHATERLELSNDLRDALARDELQLYYQPVVDLTTGSLLGVEARARWHHPQRGPVPPARFVDVAETTGLSTHLDRWVLRQVASDAQRLAPAMPSGLRIAVNISARHLADDDLEEAVLATARSRTLAGGRLVLEITENAVMDDPERASVLLERLKAGGVESAIDDFGTGYSALGYLRRLPVTTLKIDRCFVRNITDDSNALAIATSILQLAKMMGLSTIAEGVETADQLSVLRRLGCVAGQGYLWSPAVPAEALVQVVGRLPEGRFMVSGRDPVPSGSWRR